MAQFMSPSFVINSQKSGLFEAYETMNLDKQIDQFCKESWNLEEDQ